MGGSRFLPMKILSKDHTHKHTCTRREGREGACLHRFILGNTECEFIYAYVINISLYVSPVGPHQALIRGSLAIAL